MFSQVHTLMQLSITYMIAIRYRTVIPKTTDWPICEAWIQTLPPESKPLTPNPAACARRVSWCHFLQTSSTSYSLLHRAIIVPYFTSTCNIEGAFSEDTISLRHSRMSTSKLRKLQFTVQILKNSQWNIVETWAESVPLNLQHWPKNSFIVSTLHMSMYETMVTASNYHMLVNKQKFWILGTNFWGLDSENLRDLVIIGHSAPEGCGGAAKQLAGYQLHVWTQRKVMRPIVPDLPHLL